MAMSGTVSSNIGTNGYLIQIPWSVTYDTNTMLATVSISAAIKKSGSTEYPNRAYHIDGGLSNSVIANGTTIFVPDTSGNGSYNNPYHAYTNDQSIGSNSTNQYSNWQGHPNAWVYAYGTLVWSYAFTVPIDDNGIASFTLEAHCHAYNLSLDINSTSIDTSGTPAEVSSKIGYKDNGSWTNNGRIWHKENGVWRKRNLYRKNSDTPGDWSRV